MKRNFSLLRKPYNIESPWNMWVCTPRKEGIELGKKIKELPFETVLKDYEKMIYHVLSKYHIHKDLEDFYSEGALGLYQAVQNFQEEKGDFSAYAYAMIRGKILNLLKHQIKHQAHLTSITEDYQGSYNGFLNTDDFIIIRDCVQNLSTLEVEIFYRHFMKDQPLIHVARELEITYDRAKVLGKRIRNKLMYSLKPLG